MKMLVIGTSSWDRIMQVPDINEVYDDMSLWAEQYHETVGSTGAGKALCLDALGADVTLLTNIADDEFGDHIKAFYAKTSINVIPLKVDKSYAHTNLMHSKGKRITVTTHMHTEEPEFYEGAEELIKESDMVFLNINNFARKYIDLIKKHKKVCFVDIHDYDPPNPYHQEFIRAADILVCSSVYIEKHEEFLEQMIADGRQLAILTSGSEGLLALDSKQGFMRISGYNDFKFVDSNGAGDSFCAGLGLALSQGRDLRYSLEFGSVCGGLACSGKELFRLDITQKDVEEIIKKRS